MTVQDMHIGVNLEVQKIGSNINDNFEPQEVDYFLNEAVEDYIKQQYTPLKTEERSLEAQYVNENLRTLISTADIQNISVVEYLTNTIEGDLPSNYRFYLIAKTKRGDSWVNNRKIETKALKPYLETESNSPVFKEFPIVIEGNKVMVIGDTRESLDSTDQIKLTYIKDPQVIKYPTTDSDLPKHTHTDIVELAAQKMLQVIGVGQQ